MARELVLIPKLRYEQLLSCQSSCEEVSSQKDLQPETKPGVTEIKPAVAQDVTETNYKSDSHPRTEIERHDRDKHENQDLQEHEKPAGAKDIVKTAINLKTVGGAFTKKRQRKTTRDKHESKSPGGNVKSKHYVNQTFRSFLTHGSFSNVKWTPYKI